MEKQFKAGDKVSFVRQTVRARSINMRALQGTVESVNGDIATIKLRNGRCTDVRLAALTQAFQSACN
jgi:transcription elongation factor